jgi:hypothetical protein
MKSGLWPVTVVIVAFLAAITVILTFTPDSDSTTRSIVIVLVSTMGSVLSAVWVNKRNEEITDEVKKQLAVVQKTVNGNTSKLMEKIPNPACSCRESDPPKGNSVVPMP